MRALILLIAFAILLLPLHSCAQDVFREFDTDVTRYSIDLSLILDGGPPKDGIPAINDPKFVPVDEANLEDDMRGMFVEFDGEQRFYPYNILVWHEIVNDRIGDHHIAVTFCPLCGSAILFDREIDSEILQFGVTGLLYQSNMLMYDTMTESFWSQTLREVVVGTYTGQKLEILPFQLITFEDVKEQYPQATVLSEDTGFRRNYNRYPYGDYEENFSLIFPVLREDDRYHPKKMFFIFDAGETNVAADPDMLDDGQTLQNEINGEAVTLLRSGNELYATDENNELLPGYWEMWFSWYIHHAEDGFVWD